MTRTHLASVTNARASCASAEFLSPSHLSGLNRTSSLSGADRAESLLGGGSTGQLGSQLNCSTTYTPDFYVRALSDLQFVKVRARGDRKTGRGVT